MELVDSFMDFVRRLGAPRVIGALVITGVGIAGIWALVAWGNAPEYVAVVRGVPLDVIASAEQALEDEDIESHLSASGAEVMVEAKDAAAARVALAERGVAASDRAGFEIFDEATWGMTDFTQRINYRRALEGELERSIGQMRGISSAEVHLALREGSVYQTMGQPVEASVLLSVASGARPTSQQVEAITFLLASAVDGLSSEAVSVLDDAGRVLSAASEPNSPGRLDRRRLELQSELEEHLERRASELLEPLVGASNVRVRVAARLDFEQVERRTEAVDPNQQVLTGEERSEIEPGDPSQGACVHDPAQHLRRHAHQRILDAGARCAIDRLTVAVALNEDLPRAGDPAMLQRIEELVGNAVGIDTRRGDAVSVVALPFEAPLPTLTPEAAPPPGALDLLREFQRPLVLVIALLLAFALAIRGLSFARTALPEARPVLQAGAAARSGLAGGETMAGLPLETAGGRDGRRVAPRWIRPAWSAPGSGRASGCRRSRSAGSRADSVPIA